MSIRKQMVIGNLDSRFVGALSPKVSSGSNPDGSLKLANHAGDRNIRTPRVADKEVVKS